MCWHCYFGFSKQRLILEMLNVSIKMDEFLVSTPTIIKRKFQPAQHLNLFSKPTMQNIPRL